MPLRGRASRHLRLCIGRERKPMRNGMVVWMGVVGFSALLAACGGGHSGTEGGSPSGSPPAPPPPAAQHFLGVSKTGSGTGPPSPAGNDLGPACSPPVRRGKQGGPPP